MKQLHALIRLGPDAVPLGSQRVSVFHPCSCYDAKGRIGGFSDSKSTSFAEHLSQEQGGKTSRETLVLTPMMGPRA